MIFLSDYKRMVSYLYNYENQIKHNNVGYVKIELRDNMCKLTVNLKVLSVSKGSLRVYIYTREAGKIKGIFIDDMNIKNGMGELRIITRSDSVMDSGYSFEDMGGVIVYDSLEKYFGTEWDDKPIIFDNLEETSKEVVTKEAAEEEVQKENLADSETISTNEENKASSNIEAEKEKIAAASEGNSVKSENPSINLETINNIYKMYRTIQNGNNMVKTYGVENENIEPSEKSSQEENITEEKEIEETVSASEEIKTEEKAADNKYKEDMVIKEKLINNLMEKRNEKRSFVVKKIFSNYPKMYPFSDGEVIDCVRIEPQDIGMLPMEFWVLGNNSFLLHGYYSYRHLIFAAIEEENKEKYILGVPGVNQNKEHFMAKMFGFEHFKGIKTEDTSGEFGYWYKILNL